MLKHTKGFRNTRKSKERQAKQALFNAWSHAFTHRRDKKSDFRRLWQTKISAGSTAEGLSYSKLMGALKKKNILLNRKILSELAEHEPDTFRRVIESAQK